MQEVQFIIIFYIFLFIYLTSDLEIRVYACDKQ